MALVFRDQQVLTSGPGLHAFVVGVSKYTHLPNGGGAPAADGFGLKQLTSTALSAFRIYEWLLKNRDLLPRRLATVHLLLSPSQKELDTVPALAALAVERAQRRNFATDAKSWRTFARRSDDEVSLFYFAGHGLAREKDDSVILCEDFGDPAEGPLHNAVDHDHLVAGMAPLKRATERVARRQVYFVDACRNDVPTAGQVERQNVPDLWDIELGGRDDRDLPIFFGAIPGTEAMALDGVQSLFSQALIACLDHDAVRALAELDAAGNPRFGASVDPLNAALKVQLDAINVKLGTHQQHCLTGRVKNITLRYVDGPPEVPVRVEIDPNGDAVNVAYGVEDAHGLEVFRMASVTANPFEHPLPAGMYRFKASVANPQPPFVSFAAFGQVEPPAHPIRARVRR